MFVAYLWPRRLACNQQPFHSALPTLLQATEDFMVHLMEDCNLCAIHAKRVTISECFPALSSSTELTL